MKRIAIVITTGYGQTAKIAKGLQELLLQSGNGVHVYELQTESDLTTVAVDRYDVVILGGPIYGGKYPHLLVEWTRSHLYSLNLKPTAFFTVSLNAADPGPLARSEDIRLISEFLDITGLKPILTKSLIGAVNYTQYGPMKRWMMRRICKAAGGPTDTSCDHELTDWGVVREFAEEVVDAAEMAMPDQKAALV